MFKIHFVHSHTYEMCHWDNRLMICLCGVVSKRKEWAKKNVKSIPHIAFWCLLANPRSEFYSVNPFIYWENNDGEKRVRDTRTFMCTKRKMRKGQLKQHEITSANIKKLLLHQMLGILNRPDNDARSLVCLLKGRCCCCYNLTQREGRDFLSMERGEIMVNRENICGSRRAVENWDFKGFFPELIFNLNINNFHWLSCSENCLFCVSHSDVIKILECSFKNKRNGIKN